jgi:RND family efflux transporter MFP subunit
LCLALVGCEKNTVALETPPPLKVPVSVPLEREVTDYEDFTGRTESVSWVEVRARSTGYLNKVNFKDGALVQKGQVLFEIDPRLYEMELLRADATVTQAKSRLVRLENDYQRAQNLYASKVISKEDFDRIISDRGEADATVGVALASRAMAKQHLDYTKVTAPITGIVSRRSKDPGNLIKQDDTVLTTIVAVDPMYATFEVDERTLLRLRRLVKEGAIPSIEKNEVPFRIGLADEEGFSRSGKINFVDNQVDTGTGTLRLRGTFSNADGLFSPGLFVRVRLQIGTPHKVLLIADRAIGTDQGDKYLFVVNDDNKVEYRQVTLGPLHDGLRVVE